MIMIFNGNDGDDNKDIDDDDSDIGDNDCDDDYDNGALWFILIYICKLNNKVHSH